MRNMAGVILLFLFMFLVVPNLTLADNQAGMPVTGSPAASAIVAAAQTTICSSPYTVQAGDTLSGIARKCGADYGALLAANPSYTNPDLIFPGQALNIPAGSVPVTGGTGGQTYTVVSGDWLASIARRYNTTSPAILAANPWITNPNLIYPGWVITLPANSGPGIPSTGGQSYTIVLGDTLSGIASRFNTSTAALMAANPFITNPDVILAGWVISIR
jgi:lysozyme